MGEERQGYFIYIFNLYNKNVLEAKANKFLEYLLYEWLVGLLEPEAQSHGNLLWMPELTVDFSSQRTHPLSSCYVHLANMSAYTVALAPAPHTHMHAILFATFVAKTCELYYRQTWLQIPNFSLTKLVCPLKKLILVVRASVFPSQHDGEN